MDGMARWREPSCTGLLGRVVEDDLGSYLVAWAGDGAPAAQANLTRFVSDERRALEGSESPNAFWEESTDQWQQVKTWVKRHERTGNSS